MIFIDSPPQIRSTRLTVLVGVSVIGLLSAVGLFTFSLDKAWTEEDIQKQVQKKAQEFQKLIPTYQRSGGRMEKVESIIKSFEAHLGDDNYDDALIKINEALAVIKGTSKSTSRNLLRSASPSTPASPVIKKTMASQPSSEPASRGKFLSSPRSVSRLGEIPDDAAIVLFENRVPHAKKPVNVVIMNLKGKNVSQITFNTTPREYEHAAISPDRKYMVVNFWIRRSRRKPVSQAWLIDFENKTERQVLPDYYSVGDGGVDWDHAGYFYFGAQKIKNDVTSDIYKLKVEGDELIRLTDGSPHHKADVSVSEDGKMFAFVQLGRRGYVEIWVGHTNGSGARMVYRSGRAGIASAHDPELSPNNKMVVFSRFNSKYKVYPEYPGLEKGSDIYRVNIDGSGLKRIAPEGAVLALPDWLGNDILYMEFNKKDNYMGSTLIDKNGKHRRRVGRNLVHGKFIPPRILK